jgi:hypothetical protein
LPLPTHVLLTFASGVLAALAGRADIRADPKPVLRSQAFLAYLLYAGLVVAPVSLYFVIFHGDWYLLYLVDTVRVPWVLVFVAIVLEALIGAAGFVLGGAFIRSQREQWAGALVGVVGSIALAVVPLGFERISRVGTFAQLQGDFGLVPFGGALLQGSLWMALWSALALGFLVYRLGPGARRQ